MGMLDGLSFLPLDQIMQGMENLRNVQPPEDRPLIEYFDATCVSGTQERVNAAGEIRRASSTWNVHKETITSIYIYIYIYIYIVEEKTVSTCYNLLFY